MLHRSDCHALAHSTSFNTQPDNFKEHTACVTSSLKGAVYPNKLFIAVFFSLRINPRQCIFKKLSFPNRLQETNSMTLNESVKSQARNA